MISPSEFLGMFSPELRVEDKLGKEYEINKAIYEKIQFNRKSDVDPQIKGNGWQEILKLVTSKKKTEIEIGQSLRPALLNEPIIDVSHVVDRRVLGSYSPELLDLLNSNQANPEAVFVVLEYFMRDKYHNLSGAQAREVATLFPPTQPSEDFGAYRQRVDPAIQDRNISGKDSGESWIIKREVFDMLELIDNIKTVHLPQKSGKKTIFITDLMRVAGNALHTAHEASSRMGVQRINARDEQLFNSPETPKYRNMYGETVKRLLVRPDLFLLLAGFSGQRNLVEDFEKIFRYPETIQVEGAEHIPKTGGMIVAFSHFDQSRDATVPPNWELTKMLQTLTQARARPDINLVAYLTYFVDITPSKLQPMVRKLIDKATQKAEKTYGIKFVDVAAHGPKMNKFMNDTLSSLQNGELVVLSPEGVPAREVLEPKRGVGTLARMSHAPVVGIAFREDQLPDGSFVHKMIITPPIKYRESIIPGNGHKEKDQEFANVVMRDVAHQLPERQRGVFG